LGNLKERDHLGVLGIDGRILLKVYLKGMVCEYVDWIHLAQDMAQWGERGRRELINTVMNLRVP
jgi:hypothetical protein